MNDPKPLDIMHIENLESGLSYLGSIPLANPAVAEGQFLRFLDSLLIDPPDAEDLFLLLEQSRVSLCFVEEEMARRYHNKPLILGDVEESAFQQVVSAWRRMAKAYETCARLQGPEPGNPGYRTRVATILHRCIYYCGMIALEHFRARRELPQGLWLDLHGYYATAEEWGVATEPVQDALEHEQTTTHCAAAYVTALLIELASPFSHSVRDLNLIRRWASQWAPLVAVQRLGEDPEVPPYVIQLMEDRGLHPAANSEDFGAEVRRLDSTRLKQQMKAILNQLAQKVPPSQLGLGEETTSHVSTLLHSLARTWNQQSSPRRFRRFPIQGTGRVALGFDAMHYYIGGEVEFEQQHTAATYSRNDFDALFTFRDRENPGQRLSIQAAPDYPIDEWGISNHSANGFRLTRSAAGQKIRHDQLLAICPEDGDRFLLGHATWLMQTADDGIVAGVALLPGVPVVVGVRIAGVNGSGNHQFVRGFLLPPTPAFDEPSSIILPPGMYSGSRVIDVQQGEHIWQLRLKAVMHRGMDFDRISFDAV